MGNGHLKKRAIELIETPGATQAEKLNLLLQLVLDQGDVIDRLAKDAAANPLTWIPAAWRQRVVIALGGWFAWVTLNLNGVSISIPAVFGWFKDLR